MRKVGRMQPQSYDEKDSFFSGQMVGMIVLVKLIEETPKIMDNPEVLEKLRWKCAQNLESYFEQPAEDILLNIDRIKEATK